MDRCHVRYIENSRECFSGPWLWSDIVEHAKSGKFKHRFTWSGLNYGDGDTNKMWIIFDDGYGTPRFDKNGLPVHLGMSIADVEGIAK